LSFTKVIDRGVGDGVVMLAGVAPTCEKRALATRARPLPQSGYHASVVGDDPVSHGPTTPSCGTAASTTCFD
jgi:hypothetical protein